MLGWRPERPILRRSQTSNYLKVFVKYRSTKEAAHKLRQTAQAQGGYFSSRQAAEAGYGYSHLDYHVGTGVMERVAHGVYRLPSVAVSPHDDLIRLALWSRDRSDRIQAVVSHATALTVHELGLLLPDRVHLTVPPGFRKPPPKGCLLHRRELPRSEVEEREGFNVTTVQRTLVDVAHSTDVPYDEVIRAAREALDRGLIATSALADALVRENAPTTMLADLRLRGRRSK